jgi:hypothetical protein
VVDEQRQLATTARLEAAAGLRLVYLSVTGSPNSAAMAGCG